MASGPFRFDRFLLDPDNRRLTRDGEPVALNGRYLDALSLLVREAGRLVSKDRFLDEVWRGVPVTDEALTQCIRTLRRQLGDDAGRPRFIETVPKHGYRFIAPVEHAASDTRVAPPTSLGATAASGSPHVLRLGAAGTLGGGVAGLIGGLFYGFAAAARSPQQGMGAVSVLIVLVCLTSLLALAGGAGVSFGIASAERAATHRGAWRIAGGALGGLIVGALVKLVGLDAFNLLLGQAPGDITGAPEGALLGASVGLGASLALSGTGHTSLRRGTALAALTGAGGGLVISLCGGRLMGGSLDLLSRDFPGSRLRLDQIGAIFGETGFGPVSRAATSALEAALFGACIAGAMILARRAGTSGRS